MTGNFIQWALGGFALILLSASPVLAQEKTTTLDTVVVTATRAEEKLREVTSNVTVINSQTIKNSSAKNLGQLLNQQGFYSTYSTWGVDSQLSIRGMRQSSGAGGELNGNILMLIDGRRISASNLNTIGLDNIERIEIIRGPSAVQYGPAAMGGVVNLITKKGGDDFKLAVEAGIGSFGLNKESFSTSGKKNDFDFSVGVNRTSFGDYSLSNGEKWVNTSLGSLVTGNIDLGYTFLDRHRIGLNYNLSDANNHKLPGGGWSETGAINQNDDYGSYDQKNYNTAIQYDGETADEAFNWMLRYSFGKAENNRQSFSPAYGDSSGQNKVNIKEFTAQVGYEGSIWSALLGYDHLKYDLEGQSASAWGNTKTTGTSKDSAVYLSTKLKLFEERLILTAGGRYDYYKLGTDMLSSSSDNNFAPSVGLAFLPVEWLKLRANYSEGFKVPTPQQMSGSQYGSNSYIPNPNLQPEKSKTWEIGTDVNWEYISSSLTYFHTNWDNKIQSFGTGQANQFQYRNVKAATIAGLEFSFGVDLGQAFSQDFELRPYGSLTYLTTMKNKDNSGLAGSVQDLGTSTLIYTPKLMANYGITFNHPEYDFMTNVNATYYGKNKVQDWTKAGPPSWKAPVVENPTGTVVDLSLEKGLFEFGEGGNMGKLKLRAEVNNIFNEKNEMYLDYPGPGRNFYVGVRYEY